MKTSKIKLFPVISCVIALVLVGCNGEREWTVIEETTVPIPVNEEEDNAPVLSNLTTGIIVTIHIRENEISLVDSSIELVPKLSPRDDKTGCFLAKGISRDGEIIMNRWIPDLEYISVENVGLKRQRERFVTFVLPTEKPMDKIVIQLKPDLPEQEFDVSEVFDEFCEKYSGNKLCR